MKTLLSGPDGADVASDGHLLKNREKGIGTSDGIHLTYDLCNGIKSLPHIQAPQEGPPQEGPGAMGAGGNGTQVLNL